MKKFISIGMCVALMSAIGACGSGTYAANQIYDSNYGITYVDACNMGVYQACDRLYGHAYWNNHPRRNVKLTPQYMKVYYVQHPAAKQKFLSLKKKQKSYQSSQKPNSTVQKTVTIKRPSQSASSFSTYKPKKR